MKKTFLALALLLLPLTSFAATTVTCFGRTYIDQSLTLTVANSKLTMVLIHTQGSSPMAYAAREVRSLGTTSLYFLSGISDLLEVQNKVLHQQAGWLNIGNEKFDCQAN